MTYSYIEYELPLSQLMLGEGEVPHLRMSAKSAVVPHRF